MFDGWNIWCSNTFCKLYVWKMVVGYSVVFVWDTVYWAAGMSGRQDAEIGS